MLISTKGRYALQVMIALASHGGGEFVPLKSIADECGFSNPFYFSRLFKKYMRVNPDFYRKNH